MEEGSSLVERIDGTEFDLSEMGSLTPLTVVECSNCLQKFISASELTKAFLYEVEDEAGTPDTFAEVTILDALNYILRWRSFGITFQRHSGQTLQFEESDTTFCKGCAGASAKLYTSIRSFDALTQKESRINQMTNTFLETIVELANVSKAPDPEPKREQLDPPTQAHQKSSVKTTNTKFIPYKHEVELIPIETSYTAADVNVPTEFPEALMVLETTLGSGERTLEKQITSFACDACGANFTKKTNLTRHLLLTHEIGEGREKSFKCDKCDRSFHFQYMLNSHARTHSDARSEQCPQCPMKFKGKDGLFHHMKDVHVQRPEDEKPRCNLCNATFKQERSLQEHMECIHRVGTGRKLIPCPKCGVQFKRKRSMLAHLRNGKCDSKRVKRKEGNLKGNKMSRPKRPVVVKVSISRSELNPDLSYPCPFHCGKTFARKSSMMSHTLHLCRLKPKEEYEFEDEEECVLPTANVMILANQDHRSTPRSNVREKKIFEGQTPTHPALDSVNEGILKSFLDEEGDKDGV